MESSQPLRRKILEYLKTHHTMTIASCQGNDPWAAAVFYANDGFELYFFSHPHSRHGLNMTANRRVSAAIHEDYRDWRAVRGIQLEGRAERLRSSARQAKFWNIYRKKFPFVDEFFRPGPLREMLLPKLAGIGLYKIVPATIWYIDNSAGFGHRERLSFAELSGRNG